MTSHYLGMNSQTGRAISEIEHIRQSVTDILLTPRGSRVMRRDYGSDLPDLIDQPQNLTLQLKISSATYSALRKYEPRITVTSASLAEVEGKATLVIKGYRSDSQQALALSIPVIGATA